MKYNYVESMKEDILEYLKENYESIEEVNEEQLYDELWTDDSVTGNGSGSYTFNSYKAKEYLEGNYDLLQDALINFGYDNLPVEKITDYEYQDVTIRCYLLSQAIHEALKEF